MKHYFHPMSRAVTTNWMLEELEAPHEQILIDFTAGENDTPEYRSINPMGKLPTLVDDNVIVTECAAICAYLADKFIEKELAPPPGSSLRGAYYRYLFFPGSTLEPMLALNQSGFSDYEPRSAGWGDLPRCLATVESMTPESGWALGSGFSAADVVFGGMLDSSMRFGLLENVSSRVRAYVERINARPLYQSTHAW